PVASASRAAARTSAPGLCALPATARGAARTNHPALPAFRATCAGAASADAAELSALAADDAPGAQAGAPWAAQVTEAGQVEISVPLAAAQTHALTAAASAKPPRCAACGRA